MNDFVPIDADHLTPEQIEQHLSQLYNELARAQMQLRDKRDEEVEAKHAYEAVRTAALLSEERPRVSAKDGVTAAERDAWVDDRTADEKYTLRVAETERANAEDYLRILRQQVDIIRSLGASTRQAFEIAGRVQ